MQRVLSYRSAVCPSVRPYVTRVYIVTKRTKVLPTFLNQMKGKFIYFFGHKEWLVGDAPFYLKFWVKLTQSASKTAIFNRYSLVQLQALHLVKQVVSYRRETALHCGSFVAQISMLFSVFKEHCCRLLLQLVSPVNRQRLKCHRMQRRSLLGLLAKIKV